MLRLRTLSELAAATFSRTKTRLSVSEKFGCKTLNVRNIRHQNTAAAEPFLNGSSSIYIEEMYNAWQQDPSLVHKVNMYGFVLNVTSHCVFWLPLCSIIKNSTFQLFYLYMTRQSAPY